MIRVRTAYSFRAAVGKLDEVMDRLIECGYPAAPITDRASTFGFVRWNKLAKKNGIRPVFGVELAVTDSWQAKKPTMDYWTFLAIDDLEPINKLVYLATTQFRYEPLLTYEQAQAATGVYRIAGRRAMLEHVKPDPHTFLAVGPGSVRGHTRMAVERGITLVAASDNKFPAVGDLGFYEIVCGRNASAQTYNQHIQTAQEWADSVSNLGLNETQIMDAFALSDHLLSNCRASIKQATLLKPERPATLREMCLDGAKRAGCDLSDPVYAARLDKELALIAEKNFEDYFYIVADICTVARKTMIVGPARGSSCGSLVCYLLGITTVDPIPYGLIFERFIDINRNDLPDVDIDFSDQQRHLVFEYLNRKYGAERVARLGTVALYKPNSALNEASAALQVPKWKTDKVVDSLIQRSSGDARAMNSLEDTLKEMIAGKELLVEYPEIMVACRMEGHPRHYSQHAAGIIICDHPVDEYVAVDHRSGATMCDKKDAEDLNLLKIDALGLTQLSVFEDALELAGLPRDTLEKLTPDDPTVFKVLNEGKFSGIFQFNGLALKGISRQLTISDFNDIVAITALARPGPLASGGTNEWIKRKKGEVAVSYPHPVFEPYLKDTLGIVIYQEQVMEIGRNIGDLSWGDVSELRRAMSKSLGKEFFDRFGDRWKIGAAAKGVPKDKMDKVWDDLCSYGSWSFNKSHSVAYGLISYYCCWLKTYYPFEFAAATLSHEGDPDRQMIILREMVDEGFDYIPVSAELSTNKWTVGWKDDKRCLVGPLSNVKGIGPQMMSQIIGARARGEPLPSRAQKLLTKPITSIDSLWPIRDARIRILPDPFERNITTNPTPVRALLDDTTKRDVLIFGVFIKINPRDENELVKVAKRGYEIKNQPTASLNLQIADDTGVIFGKVDRFKFERVGRPIMDRGRPGKALYAIKGQLSGTTSFQMVSVENVRYLGDIDEK